tara:strand:- start:191 stop:529 length:339 start_codon:yes stop_codon:yes gene_type:complete
MAPRLYKDLTEKQIDNPFWIKDILPRRGVVAGKYQLIKLHKDSHFHEFNEIISPKLISDEKLINPSINASYDVEKDIIYLLNFSQYCQNLKVQFNWKNTLPIYPTSPIDKNT